MKCVVYTGITGSKRRQCMYELRDFAKKNNKNFEILDPWEETKKLYPKIREDTILNIDDEVRLDYFEKAYKIVAKNLNDLRAGQQDAVVAIPMHPVFYWKSGFKDAIRDNFLDWLSPDIFITVINNLRELKDNLDRDKYSRFPDITLLEILQWRDREMKDTIRWALKFKRDHVVLARKEPIETSYGVLFTNYKRIYFSYPMSYVSPQQMNNAQKMIRKLRSMGYVVFDPASIDDAKYVGELHEKLRSKTGIITEKELFRIAEVVGDHTVDLDYRLIDQSNMVVVRYPSVEYKKFIKEKDEVAPAIYVPLSAGVICEMVWGHNKGKKVFAAWLPKNIKPSPFFRYHCKPQPFFTSEDDLLSHLQKNEPPQ